MKTVALARRGVGLEGGPIMYEPSRNLFSFHIAGFQHHDGALVLGKLKAGDTLELVPERDNPYDAEAIAVKFHGAMLGYVPADSVGPLSTLFFLRTWRCLRVPRAPGRTRAQSLASGPCRRVRARCAIK